MLLVIGFEFQDWGEYRHRIKKSVKKENENDEKNRLVSLPTDAHESFPRDTADALQVELLDHRA